MTPKTAPSAGPYTLEELNRRLVIPDEFRQHVSGRRLIATVEALARAEARVAEFEKLQAAWLMSPEAAKRLEGYRELAAKCAALENERDSLRERAEAAERDRARFEKTMTAERIRAGELLASEVLRREAAEKALAEKREEAKGLYENMMEFKVERDEARAQLAERFTVAECVEMMTMAVGGPLVPHQASAILDRIKKSRGGK